MRPQASRICSACAVSTTSEEVEAEVQPARRRPDLLGDGGREGDDVVLGVRSISSMRAMSKRALRAQLARGLGGHEPGLRHRVGGRELHLEPRFVAALLAPDRAHLRMRIALNHDR